MKSYTTNTLLFSYGRKKDKRKVVVVEVVVVPLPVEEEEGEVCWVQEEEEDDPLLREEGVVEVLEGVDVEVVAEEGPVHIVREVVAVYPTWEEVEVGKGGVVEVPEVVVEVDTTPIPVTVVGVAEVEVEEDPVAGADRTEDYPW